MIGQGIAALKLGNGSLAVSIFLKVTAGQPDDPDHWVQLALAHELLQDHKAALESLDGALRLNPRHLTALLIKAQCFERLGQEHEAAQFYGAALAVAPSFDRLDPNLKPIVRHAHAACRLYRLARETAMRAAVGAVHERLGNQKTGRFDQALDIFVGKKHVYKQQPHQFYFPGLPTIQFYDRAEFPWLDAIESKTPEIEVELREALRQDLGFTPYVDYADTVPLDQWRELNHSSRWDAFHLWRDGKLVPSNATRCPITIQALTCAPAPDLPARSPSAMFSVLRAHAHIPPHTGVSNTRLVVHLPLIVPAGCRFRVGNEVREWRVGEALIFDDTIEHEAWNDSNQDRVVLIFDIWSPYLSDPEKELLRNLMVAADEFAAAPVSKGSNDHSRPDQA